MESSDLSLEKLSESNKTKFSTQLYLQTADALSLASFIHSPSAAVSSECFKQNFSTLHAFPFSQGQQESTSRVNQFKSASSS